MLNQDESLKRQIGLIGLLFTGITGIIGSGWLFASMFAAQIAGPAAIISWVIGGFIAITIALVYAELGGMFPIAGSLARIPNFSHGHVCSFVAGWLCWIAYVTTAPIEVMAVLDYASNYLPWLTVVQQGERVFTNEGILVAAFMMLIFTAINLMGVKWLIRANTSITFWKLTVPVMVPVILIYVGFKAENFTEFGGFAPHGVAGIFGAVSSGGSCSACLGSAQLWIWPVRLKIPSATFLWQ